MNQPNPATLVLARIAIFLQLGLPLMMLVIGGVALIQGADRVRSGVTFSLGALAVALTFLVGLTTGQGRRGAWVGAVLLQLAFAAAYCGVIYWTQVAPSQEGMLAFSGLFIGTPLVLLSLTGVVLLLVPSTARYCLRRP
jgi:hypothetical protein